MSDKVHIDFINVPKNAFWFHESNFLT